LIKKLDLYIWRELMIPFLAGTVAVSFMFSINQLIAILKTISVQNVPRESIVLDLLYKYPSWLNMTLPIGISLGASLAFSRLARESELTAMRAAGTPIMRVIRPVMLFGVVVAVGQFFLVERVMPKANMKDVEIERKVGMLGIMPQFQSNIVVRLKDYTVSLGSVSRTPHDTLQVTEISLIRRPTPVQTEIISAKTGEYDDGIWTLNDAYVWLLNDLTLTGARPEKRIIIDQRVILDDLFNPRTEETQTISELGAAIQNGRRTGLDTKSLEVAYHTRFSEPASGIIFACIAPIFALLFARSGGFTGVLLSIVLVMLYYNVYVVSTEIFGRLGWMPPIAAAWLPNIIFAIVGILAVRKLE
jgi:lipopolysaccharide export system permease protein